MSVVTCVCEKTFEADIPETVDLSAGAETVESILRGTFLTFTCPHCGHSVKPEVPIRFTDPGKGRDIYLIPERDRNRFLLGQIEHPPVKRIVIGYAELVEKLKIYTEKLDDCAVELIKYYILVKAGSGASPSIYFDRIDENMLVFDILGLREDEIAEIKIKREVYDKAEAELPLKRQEEPYNMFLQPPYVSISKIEIEEM